MWKIWGVWIRKAFEFCRYNLVDYSDERLEDKNIKRNVALGGPV